MVPDGVHSLGVESHASGCGGDVIQLMLHVRDDSKLSVQGLPLTKEDNSTDGSGLVLESEKTLIYRSAHP